MSRKKIAKLIGRIGDYYYYVCDDIFRHAKDFHGATGTVLRPISKEEYENRTDPKNPDVLDSFRESWVTAITTGKTQDSLAGWVEMVLDVDGDEAVFDFSGYDYWDLIRKAVPELTEDDYPVFECVGGGRCFRASMKWDEIYDKKVWGKILKAEK